jgi:hypothetical protein
MPMGQGRNLFRIPNPDHGFQQIDLFRDRVQELTQHSLGQLSVAQQSTNQLFAIQSVRIPLTCSIHLMYHRPCLPSTFPHQHEG